MKAGESGKDAQKKLVAIGTGAVAMALSLAYLGGLFFLPTSEVSFSCQAGCVTRLSRARHDSSWPRGNSEAERVWSNAQARLQARLQP